MKDNILYETVKEIVNQYESIRSMLEAGGVEMEYLDAALEEIEKLTADNGGSSVGSAGKSSVLSKVKRWMEDAVLKLYWEEIDVLSDAQIETSRDIYSRTLEEGTELSDMEITWLDRVLFQQYLLTYFSSFQNVKSGRGLNYELEYLIGQKENDKENLLVVCEKIMAIREAANLLYLVSDAEKMQQAHTMALAIGGGSANAAIIETIRWGILAAWAFGESVLDVRALLADKKIPLVKESDTWTLQLENIGKLEEGFQMAKESELGIGYATYVGTLLLLESDENIAMRSLNLQEATIRNIKKNSDFRIDSLVVWAEGEINYKYAPVFPFLEVLHAKNRWEYKMCARKEYGYY